MNDYREFRINEVFEKLAVRKLPYKAGDLPSSPEGNFVLPALTAGVQNQGLVNYVPKDEATILKNAISVSANGANTGAMFYQSCDFTVLQDAYAIDLIEKPKLLERAHYLYLLTALRKTIQGNYTWSNKANWERIQTEKITLPVKQDLSLDYDYMASTIKEVEATYFGRLQEYAKAP